MIYIMTKKVANNRSITPIPSRHYYSVIHSGYKRFGFNGKILTETLLESVMRCSSTHILLFVYCVFVRDGLCDDRPFLLFWAVKIVTLPLHKPDSFRQMFGVIICSPR